MWACLHGTGSVQAKLERAIVGLDTPASEWYPESAEHIRTACARRPQFVGVFANQAAADVNRIALDAKLDIIQLSGHEGMNTAGEHVLPVIKAVHIAHEATLGEVTAAFQQGRPHALLLDTKSPSQPGMMGGTGEVFDWALGAEAQQVAPLFLAGGLSPDNVFDAVQQVTAPSPRLPARYHPLSLLFSSPFLFVVSRPRCCESRR